MSIPVREFTAEEQISIIHQRLSDLKRRAPFVDDNPISKKHDDSYIVWSIGSVLPCVLLEAEFLSGLRIPDRITLYFRYAASGRSAVSFQLHFAMFEGYSDYELFPRIKSLVLRMLDYEKLPHHHWRS